MFNSIDYIVTAKHYARREGASSVKERILKTRDRLYKRNSIPITIKDIDQTRGGAVQARIELGQWIADCECGGAEFVAPEEPIFFCFSCGNRANGSVPRPVVFPEETTRLEIERLVLERPVDDRQGLDDLQRAHMARPVIVVEVETGAFEPFTPEELARIEQGETITPRPIMGTLPLTRTWNANETVEDLQRQNEPVKKWKENLKKERENL